MTEEARPDHELLDAWRNQDAQSGNDLVKRHFAAVFAFFRTKVPDPAQIDELVQRTFLGCVESVERIDATRSFRAYLFGIARRQLIYHYRRARLESARFDPMLGSVRDVMGSVGRIIAAREQEQLLFEALNELPLDLQCALELHYWEQMSVAEVAEVLEIPPGTVKSRLFRARSALRDSLRALGAQDSTSDASIARLTELRETVNAARPKKP